MKPMRPSAQAQFFGALTVVVTAAAARAQTLSPRVAQVLPYLPPQSETLAVQQTPVEIPLAVKAGRFSMGGDGQTAKTSLPANLQIGVIAPALAERTVLLSVEARSNFRPPRGFGLMPYDGCGFVLLKPQLGQTRAALKSRVWKGMKRLTLAGQEVGVTEYKHELDVWHLYVSVPRPDMLVLATDRASMVTTLSRLQAPRLTDRAFPASWSGWKLVDATAPFWAIRRLDLPQSVGVLGPHDRDPHARALVIYNRLRATAKSTDGAKSWEYVVKYDGSAAFGRRLLANVSREVEGNISQPGQNITQFTTDFSQPQSSGYFTFYALGLLGTGIYL